MSKTQLRGHCQHCGREQAIVGTHMAKHGYRVEDHWFKGVCQGEHYQPIEHDRSVADSIIEAVRRECDELQATCRRLKAGTWTPATVRASWNHLTREYDTVAWAFATERQRSCGLQNEILRLDMRERAGRSFADGLKRIADEYHDKPLLVAQRPVGPPPIAVGEKRLAPRGVLVARYVDQGKVFWEDAKGFKAACSTRRWRAFPTA